MVINPNALGLDLPPGTVRVQPSFWRADEPATSDTWGRLLPAREAAGFQPVLLTDTQYLHPGRVADPDDLDPVATLTELWDLVREEDEEAADEPWPGLAPPGRGDEDPDVVAARVAGELAANDEWLKGARGALVPARRGADVLAALGWGGSSHHTDAVRLSAVLRSWEDRFGIRVVGLGEDLLYLAVAAPPRTVGDALAVAAEHEAFCPDAVWQDYDSRRAYAVEEVLDRDHWVFWWD
ncbi:DUF4253 domain-containing protein [Streptomyces sp. NPDC047928]|uniref:DUF4253 domain-containing protein n=1 Tax=unclassified Streptomyces TaxID=2593676 RepID=UPI00371B8096